MYHKSKIRAILVILLVLQALCISLSGKSEYSGNDIDAAIINLQNRTADYYISHGYFKLPDMCDSSMYIEAYNYVKTCFPDTHLGVDSCMWDFGRWPVAAETDSVRRALIISRNKNVLFPLNQVYSPVLKEIFKKVNENSYREKVICFSDVFDSMLKCEVRPLETDKIGINGISAIPYYVFYYDENNIICKVDSGIINYD